MRNLFSGGEVTSYISGMTQFNISNALAAITGFAILHSIEIFNKNNLRNPFNVVKSRWLRWALYLIVVFYILNFNVSNSTAFYYFQF